MSRLDDAARKPDWDFAVPVYQDALLSATDELENRLFELGQMARIGSLLSSSSRLDEVAAQGLEILLEATPAQNGSIMLSFGGDEGLAMLAAGTRGGSMTYYGPRGHPLRRFAGGEGMAGECMSTALPRVATDVEVEPRFKKGIGSIKIGSLACLPLTIDGKRLGVINLSHPEPGALPERNLGAWTLLANYLAIAISNALLLVELQTANERLSAEVEARTKSLVEANEKLTEAHGRIAGHNEELKGKVEARSAELKKALLKLEQRTASLERANSIKDEFLNNINHELKTPLNAIIGFSGLLLRDSQGLSPEQVADLELVESNGKHLQQIIDNILALREIEGGKVNPEFLRNDLTQTIQMAVASVAPRARAKGLAIAFTHAAPAPAPFLFDITLIRRVVYNLLDNAIKFSSQGAIAVALDTAAGEGGSEAVVTVKDEGRGVPPEFAERIFQKFQQAEPAMRKNEGGSGVGLTIAKNLVELHGGSLSYQPGEDGGSVFTFTLPVRG